MAYATFAEVRPLVGNILDTEFADAEITKECNAADSWVNTRTHKSDWDSNDTQYNLIVKVANKMAAVFVLEHYGMEYIDKWKDLRDQAEMLMTEIVDNMPAETGTDENILFATSKYVSYPVVLEDDEDASPYRSTAVTL